MVNKDAVKIVQKLKNLQGLQSVGITTNGIVLAKKLEELKKAGLDLINISLDTLQEKKYGFITRRPSAGFQKVIFAIFASKIDVKLTLD